MRNLCPKTRCRQCWPSFLPKSCKQIAAILTTVLFLATLIPLRLFAQAPTLGYGSGTHTYNIGAAISPLSPTSSNISPPAYGNPVAINSVFSSNPEQIARDGAGNLYVYTPPNIVKIPSGGGSPVIVTSFNGAPFFTVNAAGDLFLVNLVDGSVVKVPAGSTTQTAFATLPANQTSNGVGIDGAGNVYVHTLQSQNILKYPPGGGTPAIIPTDVISTFGMAVDETGNMYLPDYPNQKIEKIAPNGVKTDIGTGIVNTRALAVDSTGNVYVLEQNATSAIKIPADGSAMVTLGGGFKSATGIVADGFGNVYVADQLNKVVKLVKHTGGYYAGSALPPGLTLNNTTGVISGTPTMLSAAKSYAVTAYNANGSASTTVTIKVDNMPPIVNYGGPWAFAAGTPITPLSPASTVVTPPGYAATAIQVGSGFLEPTGVAVDANGNAFVADWGNHAVKKIPPGGSPAAFGTGITQPYGIAVNAAGDVYVADYASNSIKKIPAAGGSAAVIGTGFMHPMGLAVDAAGNVYVADYGNNAIKKITAGSGTVVTLGSGFNLPTGVAVDNSGNVYVADFGNNAVKMIPAGGGAVVTLGTFAGPRDIVFDGGGNMYVTEYTTNDLKEVKAGGSSVILASHYNHPLGLDIDGAGNLFVADFSNNLIDEYNPTGGFYITPFLPAGLNFSSITGTISGTPTTPAPPATYTVTAYNTAGSGSGTVSIAIADNNLSNLTISSGTLTPAFAANITAYTTSVGTSVSAVTVTPTATDPASTIKVNGTIVSSGSASQVIPLVTGLNSIAVAVTANGTTATKTYTVTVGYGATNTNLSNLKLSTGTLSPAFAAATTSYTAMVSNATTSITVTPTVSDVHATVTINGAPVVSGTASSAIQLVAGPNTITTVVTAQDGITTGTYTVVVTRAPSSNAGLANIKTSPTSTLLLTTGPGYLNFQSTVPNSFSSIQVIVTPKDNTAAITVNGEPVAAGLFSQAIPLNVGSNTITTVITAQDGITTETIIIYCIRSAPPSHNSLFVQSSVVAPPETVTIAGDGLVVHQAVSPNGDGVNDVFTIDGLANYRDNQVTIVDRNGNLVYEATGYNNGAIVFDGHSNVDGKMQAPGTYFYSLEYKAGSATKRQTGYIILKY